MGKIYLVVSSCGTYEDYFTQNEKAFYKKSDAERYAEELDETRRYSPSFKKDIWDKIEYEMDQYMSENEEPYFGNLSYTKELMADKYLELLQNNGYTSATIDDVYKQMDFQDHQFEEWQDTKIEEIELC